MNYTNDKEQIVFLRDADIASSLNGKAISSDQPITTNGIPSFDLFKNKYEELSTYDNNICAYIRDRIEVSSQNLCTELSNLRHETDVLSTDICLSVNLISGFIKDVISVDLYTLSVGTKETSILLSNQITSLWQDVKGGVNYKGHLSTFFNNKATEPEKNPYDLSDLFGYFYNTHGDTAGKIYDEDATGKFIWKSSILLNNGWLYCVKVDDYTEKLEGKIYTTKDGIKLSDRDFIIVHSHYLSAVLLSDITRENIDIIETQDDDYVRYALLNNISTYLSTDYVTKIQNLSDSISTTTSLSVKNLQNLIISNDKDISYLSAEVSCNDNDIKFLSDDICRLCTEISSNIDSLSTSLSDITKLSVENLLNLIISNDKDISYLSAEVSCNDNDIKFLSNKLSIEIARNIDHLAYFGEVKLSTDYIDPEEGAILNNLLFGLVYTNISVAGNRSKRVKKGTFFKAVGNDLSIYSTTDTVSVVDIHDNDFLMFNKQVNEISDLRFSDVEIIKDYDLSVKLLQDLIIGNDKDISFLSANVDYLSANLSGFVHTRELLFNEEKTVEQIAAEFAKDHWNVGDIIIIKKPIVENTTTLYSYTGYVWNGEAWAVMDGNCSAKNVYLTKDFSTDGEYTVVGNYKKGSTIPGKGKNLEAFLEDMFDTTILPTLGTPPSYSVSITNSNTYEVGATVTPTFNVAFTQGKYNYTWRTTQPTEDDGTTLKQMTVANSGNTLNVTAVGSYSFIKNVTLADGTNFTLGVSNVAYNAGKIPVNSKGADVPAVQRPTGTLGNSTASGSIKGSYYCFYGFKNSTNKFATYKDGSITKLDLAELDSNEIRGLNFKKFISYGINNTAFNTANDTVQFIVACKKGKFSSISLKQASPDLTFKLDAVQDFTIKDGGGNDVVYTLFSSTQDAAAAANTYTILAS